MIDFRLMEINVYTVSAEGAYLVMNTNKGEVIVRYR